MSMPYRRTRNAYRITDAAMTRITKSLHAALEDYRGVAGGGGLLQVLDEAIDNERMKGCSTRSDLIMGLYDNGEHLLIYYLARDLSWALWHATSRLDAIADAMKTLASVIPAEEEDTP